MKTKKSLGQNFLRDPKILKKIADSANIEKTDTVVEVGPGEGGLTKLLLEQAEKVIAIEKDENLAKLLEEKFSIEILDNKLEIVAEDILNYDIEVPDYKLIGNIPYYITGALFKKALEAQNPPKSVTFVVQKEVAERIMARDGKESILSISTKVYGEPEYGGIIKAGSFYPKPNVDSGIISIRNINKENFDTSIQNSESLFFEILKTGFAHKRKLLISNLVSRFNLDTLKMKEVFEKCGISERTRAEDLKISDWVCIAKKLL